MANTTLLMPILLCIVSATHLQQDASKADYAQLLKRAKDYDKSLDFGMLRMAYTKTATYDPVQTSVSESASIMYKASLSNEYDKVISLANTILERDYLHIQTHRILSQTYTIINNNERARYHEWIADSLITSIVKSGDGKSTSSAYCIVTNTEPYAVLHKLDFKLAGSVKSIAENGHSFLVFQVLDKSEAKSKVYFNQDAIFAWFKVGVR